MSREQLDEAWASKVDPKNRDGIEPSSATRQMAQTMRECYVAFMQAGFTMEESIRLIGAMLRAWRPDAE